MSVLPCLGSKLEDSMVGAWNYLKLHSFTWLTDG